MGNILQRSQKILTTTPTANVVKMLPMWGKGEPLYLWAERGLVHWEYAATNGFGTMTWQDAARRVQALSEMVIKSSEDRKWAKERYELQRIICDMESVIRQAKEQGSPDNPDAVRDHVRRRSKSAVVPRNIDQVIAGDPAYKL